MINTVFLDMDGIITNFNKPVCEKFDLLYPPRAYHFFPEIRPQVNDFCDRLFWQNLEWMDGGRDILEMVTKTFGLKKIYLLTKMMPNIETASGKMAWIQNNIPLYSDQIILITLGVSKSLLARPGTLLIEDCDKYVDSFCEAGGKALLVPRPWNRDWIWANETVKIVKRKLEKICQESS